MLFLQLYLFAYGKSLNTSYCNSTSAYHYQRFNRPCINPSHHLSYFSAPTQYYHNSSASYHLERVLNLSNDVEVNPGPDAAEEFSFSDSLFNEDTFNSSNSLNSSSSSSTISHHPKCSSILCIFFNTRSIGNKLTELHALIDTENPDIVAVSESWLDNNIADSETVDTSYMLFRHDRNRNDGGVFIAIKDILNPIHAPQYEHNNIESVWVEFATKGGKVLYGCIYCPKKPDLIFFNNLDELVNVVLANVHSYVSVVLTGDFNVNAPHFQPSSKVFSEGALGFARRFSNHESRLLSRSHTFAITVILDLKIHQSMWIH